MDVLDADRTRAVLRAEKPSHVVNFAAYTSVDGAEQVRRSSRASSEDPVWALNVETAGLIAEEAARIGAHLTHVSTDFVYDGTSGPYREVDAAAASSELVSWYGWTKAEGERRVRRAHGAAAVLRISYPFRANFPPKIDFARGLLRRAAEGRLPPLYTDQVITPTWIPDVTRAVNDILEGRLVGTIHCASPTTTTPFEFGGELLRRTGHSDATVARGSLREALLAPGAVRRPLRGGLLCDRLAERGVARTDWREAIGELARMSEASRPPANG